MRPDGTDTYSSPGRPIASISNVMLEFRPGPPPKKAPAKKAPATKAPAQEALKQLRIASADRSMSASVVDQFDTEMRMACLPCHKAPPAQQVPSACTAAITRLVVSSSANLDQHLIQDDVVEDRDAVARVESRSAIRRARRQLRRTIVRDAVTAERSEERVERHRPCAAR